jgi:hypothetical protein
LGRDAAKPPHGLADNGPVTNERHWLSPTPYDSSFPTGVPSARRTVRPIMLTFTFVASRPTAAVYHTTKVESEYVTAAAALDA